MLRVIGEFRPLTSSSTTTVCATESKLVRITQASSDPGAFTTPSPNLKSVGFTTFPVPLARVSMQVIFVRSYGLSMHHGLTGAPAYGLNHPTVVGVVVVE